jgi:uncharacterized membrane protein YeaQ/YmgE (transglycosylase-associated protein family)
VAFIFRAFGEHGVTGFNLGSVIVAFVGGVIILLIYVGKRVGA